MEDAHRLFGSGINRDSTSNEVISHFYEFDTKVRDCGVDMDLPEDLEANVLLPDAWHGCSGS